MEADGTKSHEELSGTRPSAMKYATKKKNRAIFLHNGRRSVNTCQFGLVLRGMKSGIVTSLDSKNKEWYACFNR